MKRSDLTSRREAIVEIGIASVLSKENVAAEVLSQCTCRISQLIRFGSVSELKNPAGLKDL